MFSVERGLKQAIKHNVPVATKEHNNKKRHSYGSRCHCYLLLGALLFTLFSEINATISSLAAHLVSRLAVTAQAANLQNLVTANTNSITSIYTTNTYRQLVESVNNYEVGVLSRNL